MKKQSIIIAIDGYAGTGKSTLAKRLARRLGYLYIDTGAMFRALTYHALNKGFFNKNLNLEECLKKDLPQLQLEFVYNPTNKDSEITLNGHNIAHHITQSKISNNVSKVAKIPSVRDYLLRLQRQWATGQNVILDGRDIGTVIFPKAQYKFFITVPIKIRAQRRYDQLLSKGENVSPQTVLENIKKRDYEDTNRTIAPLRKAKDAIEIDNSTLNIDTIVHQLYEHILKKVQDNLKDYKNI